jgi:hypothetical protein
VAAIAEVMRDQNDVLYPPILVSPTITRIPLQRRVPHCGKRQNKSSQGLLETL